MKKVYLLSFILLFFMTGILVAQRPGKENRRAIEKIEQLERAKLIDVLNLNEENSVRFFARRKEFRDKQRELFQSREVLSKEIEAKLISGIDENEKSLKDDLNNLLSIDEKIVKEKQVFYKNLSDILTPKQILKLAVFDQRFMREIREILMGRKGDKQ